MEQTTATVTARPAVNTRVPLLIFALLIVDSLHFIFARLLLPHLPPPVSAMLVIGVAAVEVAAFAIVRRKVNLAVFWEQRWFFLGVGLLVAISTNINFQVVALIDPGVAALLAKTSTIFGLGFGVIWLREQLNRQQIIGAGLALIGVFIVALQPEADYLRWGSIMILISMFLYALHTALVKQYGDEIDFTNFFLFRLLSTVGFMLLFNLATQNLVWPTAQAWAILLTAGTVDVVISRSLYYLALRRLKLSIHSIILTLSPVLAVIWTVLLFQIRPTGQQLLGGLAVLIGVFIVTTARAKTKS
jgi:drug/metabolite transporter (DMT)-like permease